MENETLALLEKMRREIADSRRRVEEVVRDEFWALENRLEGEISDIKRRMEEQLEEQAKKEKEAV